MTTFEQDLRELLATKARELFAAYGVDCSITDAVRPEDIHLCGVLGFSGDQLKGSVVVAASESALASSNPVGSDATRGWSAELTNQLVGRFKNALLRRGVELIISIPVVLGATPLVPAQSTPIEPIHLAVGIGSATIWLELQSSELAAMLAPEDLASIEAGPEEGDMLEF